MAVAALPIYASAEKGGHSNHTDTSPRLFVCVGMGRFCKSATCAANSAQRAFASTACWWGADARACEQLRQTRGLRAAHG
eukprot:10330581-Heterocapsa_arctica.AAC.1